MYAMGLFSSDTPNTFLLDVELGDFWERFRKVLSCEAVAIYVYMEGSLKPVAASSEDISKLLHAFIQKLVVRNYVSSSHITKNPEVFAYSSHRIDSLDKPCFIFPCVFQEELVGVVVVVGSQDFLGPPDFKNGLWRVFCDHVTCLITIWQKSRKIASLKSRLLSLQCAVQKVSLNMNLSTVLTDIVKLAVKTVNANCSWVSLIHPDVPELKPDTYWGIDADFFKNIRITVDNSVTSQGPSGTCVRTRIPQVVRDTQTDLCLSSWREETGKRGYKSIVAVPLMFQDRCLGAITVYSTQVNAFTREDVEVLQSFALNAATAIEHARLFEQHEQHLRKLQELNKIIASRNDLLQYVLSTQLQLTQTFLDGQGVSSITQKIAQFAGNPVIVENQFFDVLCYAGFEGHIDLDVYLKGTRNLFDLYPKEAQLLLSGTQPVYFPSVPGYGFYKGRLMAPIIPEKSVCGYLSIIEDGGLDESAFMLIDKGAIVLALAFLNEKTAFEVEQRLIGDWFSDLIKKEKTEDELVRRSKYLNYGLNQPSYLVMIDFYMESDITDVDNQGSLKSNIVSVIKKVLLSFLSQSLVVNDKDNAVILLLPTELLRKSAGSKKGIDHYISHLIGRIVNAFKDTFPCVTFLAILGGEFTTISELRRNYIDTVDALTVARLLNERDKITSKDALGAYIMLYRCKDPEWLKAFVNLHLGLLMEYDRDHRTSLVLTLDMFLRCNCNVSDAARKLFIHLNTMKYRLSKIKDILGLDLIDAETNFNLRLALMVLKIM